MTPSTILSRRSWMQWGIGAAAALPAVRAVRAANSTSPTRRIFAVGGGMHSATDENRLLLRYLLTLVSKPDPIVCMLPTAGGDDPESIVEWYEVLNQLRCRPRHLRLFGPASGLEHIERQILSADIILVPGGNTLNMLAVWRDQRVDVLLQKAWERGIVLAGESAGMICWFTQGVTDSRPDRLSGMNCLGWLPGSACPHYHSNPGRKTTYHRLLLAREIEPGVACDDGVGLLFEGRELADVVSVAPSAHAYQLSLDGRRVVETTLKSRVLTTVESK